MINEIHVGCAWVALMLLIGNPGLTYAQPLSANEPTVNSKLLEEIKRTDYTPEERRNLELVLEFFRAKNELFRTQAPLTPEIMMRYFKEDHVVIRYGMESITKLSGKEYNPASIPDQQHYIDDMVVKGDRVVVIFYIRGTHDGDFFGVSATGKPINAFEIAFLRMEDGKISESWWGADELALINQMGVPIGIP